MTKLKYSIRIKRAVEALRSEGATVTLISTLDNTEVVSWFDDIDVCDSFEFASPWKASQLAWRPARIIDNVTRNTLRPLSMVTLLTGATPLCDTLVSAGTDFDVYWAIDVVSLPSAVKAAKTTGAKVIYETFDLVQEYKTGSKIIALGRRLAESRHISRVDAFVTAGKAYADYYERRYLGRQITQRPYVLENLVEVPPGEISGAHNPRQLLFFGNLAHDRPLEMLLAAFKRGNSGNMHLTLQGRDLQKGAARRMVSRLGLEQSVTILEPCAPELGPATARDYDVGIVVLAGADENERNASTAKAATYLAAGLMVMASDLPGIRRMVGEDVRALFVDPQTADGWASAFSELSGMSDSYVQEAKQLSLSQAREWDIQGQTDGFLDLFRTVAKSSQRMEQR